MKSLLLLAARPLYVRYTELLRKVHDLEVAVDAMIQRPTWVDDSTRIFNGQRQRVAIYRELLGLFSLREVFETGTFLGDTTGYLATLSPGLRILSCELSPRFSALAASRLGRFASVAVSCEDSRSFLSRIEASEAPADGVSFFYLDAHWNGDLPLREELRIIASKRKNAIVMIDDFEVQGDPGYSFDNYGPGMELTLRAFGEEFRANGFRPFFPVAPSHEDTGYRRGCVVLASVGAVEQAMYGMKTLRSA